MPEQPPLTTQISSSSSPVLPVLKPRLESGVHGNAVKGVERDGRTQGLPVYSARGMGEEKSTYRVRRTTRFDIKDERDEPDSKRSRL